MHGVHRPAHEPGDFRRPFGVLITQFDHLKGFRSQFFEAGSQEAQFLFDLPILAAFLGAKRFRHVWRQLPGIAFGFGRDGLQHLEFGDGEQPRAEVGAGLKI